MKRILVPTDFSSSAYNALQFAIRMAKMTSAEIILAHVMESMGPVYTDYMGANKEYHEQLTRDTQRRLEELAEGLQEKELVEIHTALYSGPLNANLTGAIENNAIDLVIMGTYGASGIKERLWGSHTASFTGVSQVPVLVVPQEYNWSLPSRMLFLTEKFEEAPRVLDPVFELARLFMSRVYIVSFSDETITDPLEIIQQEKRLRGYEKRLKALYDDQVSSCHHLSGVGFEESLRDYVQEQHIDMLAMVTYQRGLLGRLFRPSMTRKISFHTKMPLLVIPAR